MREIEADPTAMLARLKSSAAMSGFSSLLGREPIRCRLGESELVVPLRRDLTQHHGAAQGAVAGAAADNACAWAAASVAGDVVTTSYTLSLAAPAKRKLLRAKGQVLKSGRRQFTARADVYAEAVGAARLVVTALAAVAKVER